MKRFNPSVRLLNSILLFVVIFSALAFTTMIKDDDELRKQFKIPLVTGEKKADVCLAPQYMMNAWYHIERNERFCETLKLDTKADKKKYYEWYEDPKETDPAEYGNDGLVVIADTVNEISMVKRPIWASYLFHHNLGSNKKILQDDTLIQEVKSFPIYIANVSKTKTVNIRTQDGSLMMVVQAQDSKKQWRNIEYWSHSWCGNSYFTINIAPQHFLFTRGIKCSGDFNTICRLKLYNRNDSLFSNTFKMWISESQFEKPKWEGE